MKYPYTLSKERLSLLSKEERELYEYEHSPYYSYEDKVICVNAFRKAKHRYMDLLESDEEFKSLSMPEKKEMSESLVKLEALKIIDNIYDIVYPEIKSVLSEKEQIKLKDALNETVFDIIESEKFKPLNEDTPGHDLTFWIPGLGWLGKLAAGILTTGIAGIVGLIMAGKDKAAAKALEKYMNRLVETTDNGLHKKKSFFSFFSRNKTKFNGDQSFSCFRSVQEIFERKIAAGTLIAGKSAGLLGKEAVKDAESNILSNDAGMTDFYNNVAQPIENLIR